MMPIRPEMKGRYPNDWGEIRLAVLERADMECERCGVPQYAVGYRDNDGRFMPLGGNGPCDAAGRGQVWPGLAPLTHKEAWSFVSDLNDHRSHHDKPPHDADGNRWFVIVLTVAHLHDHRPEVVDWQGVRYGNLAALCQRCHNRHDAAHRQRGIKERRDKHQTSLAF